jgi:hypothetical protein
MTSRRVIFGAISLTLIAAFAITAPPASAASTAVFAATGSDQTWVVPAGVTRIQIDMVGAGGGGGQAGAGSSAFGGGGGSITGVLQVTPGDTLTIIVGQGGINDNVSNPKNRNYRYGGGASGAGNTAYTNSWGSGGGRSAIRSSAASYAESGDLVTAGGGGGGGYNTNAAGGAGGGLVAGAGGSSAGGGGGTQAAGGAGGGPFEPGEPGVQYEGGYAQMSTVGTPGSEAGGGGGGYWGGGGGGDNSGGGGGSSFLGSASYFVGSTTAASGREAGATGWPSACGTTPGRGADPGATASVGTGGSGCVVITSAPALSTSSSVVEGELNPSVVISTTSNFAVGVSAGLLTIGVGTTGLSSPVVTRVSGSQITISFTGIAALGSISVTALSGAFDPTAFTGSNTVTISVSSASQISTVTTVAGGQVDPQITITSASTFTSGVSRTDFDISVGGTSLTLLTLTRIAPQEVLITFSGRAQQSTITIQAFASAFDPAALSSSNVLTIEVSPAMINDAPPAWLQAYSRLHSSAPCREGWTPSWAQWPNQGGGGFTCERRLEYRPSGWLELPGFSVHTV